MTRFPTEISSSMTDFALYTCIINVCKLKVVRFHLSATDTVACTVLFPNSAELFMHKYIHNLVLKNKRLQGSKISSAIQTLSI